MIHEKTITQFLEEASQLSGDRYIKSIGGVIQLRKENQPKEEYLA